jgi:DNA modification methylase
MSTLAGNPPMINQAKHSRAANSDANKLSPEDRSAHGWYRFVLSYPPHLVRDYLERFEIRGDDPVLDPFCGTGTTIVECKKLGIPAVGIEANPMALLAAQVKVDWSPDPDGLVQHARQVAAAALADLDRDGIADDPLPLFQSIYPDRVFDLRTLCPEQMDLLLTDSISALPLHKTLVLLDHMERLCDSHYARHERLALARALVSDISNLHFGPEVGVGTIKPDAPVIAPWLNGVQEITGDLRTLPTGNGAPSTVIHGDARYVDQVVAPGSIAAVITSPPYPNEKDYTRTTRLESVLLGLIHNKAELRALKHNLVRSNTRNVYKDDDDDQWVASHPEIQRIAEAIEARRIAMGKDSGFERMYARVTRLYFGGMAQHLANLRSVLRPGARLAYVVGDQASYLRVMIRTGQLLADIAQSLGYELVNIDLFRTRLATATKEQLREDVVVLRWPG